MADADASVLPRAIEQLYVSATMSRREGSRWGMLTGDLLVPPASSGDRAADADSRRLGGLNHFDLLHHETVYDVILAWMTQTRPDAAALEARGALTVTNV